ncbi:MAG: ABC transporter ATP-binding protein [Ruminococcaceae bacterium]|nr:ABC transporter ATP-binding protein [Oscillospiraceae bacterium]
MKNTEKKTTHLKFFGIPKILPFVKPYSVMMFLMVFLSLLGSIIDLVFPKFQEYAINNYIAYGKLDGLGVFTLVYFVLLIFKIIVDTIGAYNGTKIEMYVGRDLKQTAFDHLQTLSFSYFNRNSVGYIHSRVSSDTNRIGTLFSWYILDCIWNGTYFIGALIIMFRTNAKLSLIVLAIIPVVVATVILMQKKLTTTSRNIREVNSRITGNFNEGITGAKTIKTLVAEDKMYSEFAEKTGEIKGLSVMESRYRGILWTTLNVASYVALALVLKVGGDFTSEQIMEVGTLSLFMTYSMGLMTPIRWIINSLAQLINIQVNIERFTGLLETESDVSDSPEVVEKYGDMFNPKRENWEELKGDIEFCDVDFMYPDGDEYILKNFNLKIPHGTNVAIVGETGAGKSTLVNLVCRFFEPTAGRLLIDGRDARERSQLWLHSNIGYVLQTPHLFSGTIRENLKYGSPNATDEEIMKALKIVSAEGIVERSENGLETEVGEGGDLLSTGEKQLISFARAILCDPKILVLDEATSSIDTFTEQLIQSAIGQVIKGRTSFVIAHRLSTVRNADIILVVRDGKIIERGTHRELMREHGYYHSLYTQQYQAEAIAGVFRDTSK